MNYKSIVPKRQQALIANYIKNPTAAWITDMATIEGKNLDDPFHSSVTINEELKVDFPIGVHRAVGGLHDFPNPGDILCASLAACFEMTLRMVANHLDVRLTATKVSATGEADVRGTLMMDKTVPVAFQKMTLHIEIRVAEGTKNSVVPMLLKATERSCIILQTLKKGIPIKINSKVLNAVEAV